MHTACRINSDLLPSEFFFVFCVLRRSCTTPHPQPLHCKKRLADFASPAGMSLTKLSLGGNN